MSARILFQGARKALYLDKACQLNSKWLTKENIGIMIYKGEKSKLHAGERLRARSFATQKTAVPNDMMMNTVSLIKIRLLQV